MYILLFSCKRRFTNVFIIVIIIVIICYSSVPRNVILEESDSTVSSVTVQWSPPIEPESTLTPVIEFYTIHCSDGLASPAKVNFTKSETTTASCVNLSNAGAVYTVTVTSHSQGKEASSSLMIIACKFPCVFYPSTYNLGMANTHFRQLRLERLKVDPNKFWFQAGELNILFTLARLMTRSKSETKALQSCSE